MRVVISAAPSIDLSGYAAKLAGGRAMLRDPSAAACGRYGYQTLYEIPRDLQKRIRRTLIREHAASLRADAAVICDHSVFAWLADWMRWLWSETPAEEWDAVLEQARAAVALCDSIHHVVCGPAVAYDGYRWIDPRNARQVERLMRSLYAEFGVESRVTYVDLQEPAA